ncbi:TetR/AcrR family transcriptional regulator [Nucisporomicrobium flavum]|uniref:TetR/AcrR family transcriptional regulator n=1 Tax=Nucisporomicrobium flavum TaxID=2785915 RepID=UPI003C30130E
MAPPQSRRERPAKPALTRDGIIATAVAVMRAEGLARVTMRRLATELDTGPASLYVYVRNTAELHAAVLDELLGEVDLTPAGGAGPWQERLVSVLESYTRILFANPGLAQSALLSRPSGPHYLALIETMLTLLAEGEVPGDRAAWAIDILLQYATASAAEHAASTPVDEDTWNTLVETVRTAPPEIYPNIAALGEELLSGGERLRWAFLVVLNGILVTPRPGR